MSSIAITNLNKHTVFHMKFGKTSVHYSVFFIKSFSVFDVLCWWC